jgi:endonuclease/exonuclease/phosphatase (EEP) superfamily protein YafD
MRFLFWNIGRQARNRVIADLTSGLDVDVVLLVENGTPEQETLAALREAVSDAFFAPQSNTKRIHVFSRNHASLLREVYGTANGRLTIRQLRLGQTELLLGVVHLPDQRHFNSSDRLSEAIEVANEVRRQEERWGHRRTVLVGDFNMNPFEAGLVNANAFHATSTKASALRRSRPVQTRNYPYFYNPMWGFFGDRTPGPPGTFHYRRSAHESHDWHIFDQLLIRPDVFDIIAENVEITTGVGETRLASRKGRPLPALGSDHFPLIFSLRAEEGLDE